MLSTIKGYFKGWSSGHTPRPTQPPKAARPTFSTAKASAEQEGVKKKVGEWQRQSASTPATVPNATGATTAQVRRYIDRTGSRYQRQIDRRIQEHGNKLDAIIKAIRDKATVKDLPLSNRAVLIREQPRYIFDGAKLQIRHAFPTPTVLVKTDGSRIHYHPTLEQPVKPPPVRVGQRELRVILKSDLEHAAFIDADGHERHGKIVDTARRLKMPVQLPSLYEFPEPAPEQHADQAPDTSLFKAPNNGVPS